MNIIVSHLHQLTEVASQICQLCQPNQLWLFEGDMGSGKTTLIKEICKYWEVSETVTSPTFGIVNEYVSKTKGTLYHFDFYRIENDSQAINLGINEYFDSGNYCFIEWSTNIKSFLPDNYIIIKINIIDELTRHLEIQFYGERKF